jgi:hypothetical protein
MISKETLQIFKLCAPQWCIFARFAIPCNSTIVPIIRIRQADPKLVANSSRFLGHIDHPLWLDSLDEVFSSEIRREAVRFAISCNSTLVPIIRIRRADPKLVANSSRFLGHFDHPPWLDSLGEVSSSEIRRDAVRPLRVRRLPYPTALPHGATPEYSLEF